VIASLNIDPAALRHAARMTVAALAAYGITRAFGFAQGQWAVITCLVIMQGNIGGTLETSVARVKGTVVGAVSGGLGVLALEHLALPFWPVLGAAIVPGAIIAARKTTLRLAPVTAAIVLFGAAGTAHGLDVAIDRVFEILVGIFIGVASALIVFPERADRVFERHAATAVEALGRILAAHFARQDPVPLLAPMDAAFVRAQTAVNEATRERRLHLTSREPPAALLLALRRLRTDVALVERAMAHADAPPGDAQALAWFDETAGALRARTAPPEVALPAPEQGFAPLDFALTTLRREQASVAALLRDRFAG
jgi:uncharacterized membrane protein YccC